MTKKILVTTMRNELPFIIEWIAYHKVIGFDTIIVWSNDSDDGTTELLNHLDFSGLIEHRHWSPHKETTIASQLAEDLVAAGRVANGDWIMFLDADEFLNVHVGKGLVDDLIERIGEAQGACICWRIFGDSGHRFFPGRFISSDFTGCAPKGDADDTVKTFFRWSGDVKRLANHKPVMKPEFWSDGTFLSGVGKEMSGEGSIMASWRNGNPRGKVDAEDVGWDIAQINHYAVRTRPFVRLKRKRGQSDNLNTGAQRYNKIYYRQLNKNSARDTSILRHEKNTSAEIIRIRVDDLKDFDYSGMFEGEPYCKIVQPAAYAPIMEDQYEVIESRGVKLPFERHIISPLIEEKLRNGRYEGAECVAAERLVRPGDRVLELGAGLGLVSTKAATKLTTGRVLTFEANPDLIPLIRRSHTLNDVADKVEIRHAVLTEGPGPEKITFFQRKDFWGSSLSPGPEPYVSTVETPTVDFGAVLEEFRPTLILCDIEGGEQELLGFRPIEGVRLVVMEIHPKVYGLKGVKEIFDRMSALGFGYAFRWSRGPVIVFERVSESEQITDAQELISETQKKIEISTKSIDKSRPRVVVPTCMKNEGPYILEWLAYQRVIGVSDFIIFTNDCEDGTDQLLQRLDELGYLRHLPNPAVTSGSPHFQPTALAYAQLLPEYTAADYVISMDVDEFLNIQVGDGTIRALLAEVGPVDVISLSESLFGSSGRERFEPGFITEQFTRCSSYRPRKYRARRGVKSILRRECGLALKNHRPHESRSRGFDDVRWLDGSGAEAPRDFIVDLENGMDCRGRFELAYINHYPLRSLEAFLLKRDRGDVVVANKQVSRRYWRVRNLHDETDESILRHRDAARAEVDRMMADPEVARLHAVSIDWHRQRVAALRRDPDYIAFMEELQGLDQPATG